MILHILLTLFFRSPPTQDAGPGIEMRAKGRGISNQKSCIFFLAVFTRELKGFFQKKVVCQPDHSVQCLDKYINNLTIK